jgi:hypothetical protein
MRTKRFLGAVIYLTMLVLSGCSGGGGDTAATATETSPPVVTTPPVTTPPLPASTLTGMASKGPIQAGTVQAFAVSSGAVDRSAPIGQGLTDSSGNYSFDIGSYKGPVLVEVTGGTFTDEASGTTVTLKTPLRAIFTNISTGTNKMAVTPLTELAFRKANGAGALTADAISSANAGIAATFGLKDIVATMPDAGGSLAEQKKYANACGSISQLVYNNKNTGETLDGALTRLLTQMGNEQEQGGGLSAQSITMINSAISSFNGTGDTGTGNTGSGAGTGIGSGSTVSGFNNNDVTVAPIPIPTSGLLKIGTAGSPNVIAGIDMQINLPAGIIVDADPFSGVVADGVVTISGVAAVGTRNVTVAKYTPASIGYPAQLHVIMANALGFSLGEFVSIRFDLTTGASFPAANLFKVTSFFAKGLDGAGLSGITAAPITAVGI